MDRTSIWRKIPKHITFASWVSWLLSNPDISKKITMTTIRKALNLSKCIATIEVMMIWSSWFCDEHWVSHIHNRLGRIRPNFKGCRGFNVFACFQRCKNHQTLWRFWGIILDEADKEKLETLNKSLSDLKFSIKSTYASWPRHFIIVTEVGSDIEFEALSLMACLVERPWGWS